MTVQRKNKNIFSDKASLVARRMLSAPDNKWVVRDFVDAGLVSIGLAQGVINAMDNRGYIERSGSGPSSYTMLTNPNNLVEDWRKEYHFGMNEAHTFYSADKQILRKIKKYIKSDAYALTLHAGANQLTSHVKTEDVHLYLKSDSWDADVTALRQQLDLKELVRGGNIHFVKPYYKTSVYVNSQMINGYSVVSNLQLYLDLYNFKPRGLEHATFLKDFLAQRGKRLA
jgi:hypothetical protein